MTENWSEDDPFANEDVFNESYTAHRRGASTYSTGHKLAKQAPVTASAEEDEVEVIAEPVEDNRAEQEAFLAALSDAVASSQKGKRTRSHSRKAARSRKAAAANSREQTTRAAASHTTSASEPSFSYEEPTVDRSNVQLKRVNSGTGRHAGASSFQDAARKEDTTKSAKAKKRASRQQRAKRRQIGKRIGTIAAAVVAGVAVLYLGGVGVFSFIAMPNTTINGVNLFGMNKEEATETLSSIASDYKVTVDGEDYYIRIDGDEIGYKVDVDSLVSQVFSSTRKFLWPFKLTDTSSYSFDGACSWDETQLYDIIEDYTTAHNNEVTGPADAYTTFSTDLDKYAVISEVEGKRYQVDKVVDETSSALASFERRVDLNHDSLILPAVYSDDADLNAEADACNDLLSADFDLVVTDSFTGEERVVDHIGHATFTQWITYENGVATFDDEAMDAWCWDYANSHYTYRTTRTYTRPDGETISQGGGRYGWNYNINEFYNLLVASIREGTTGKVEVPCSQTAAVWVDEEHPIDFGNTYIDITISTQKVRYYVDGVEVLIADTVSGDINSGQGTPYGVYYINSFKTYKTHLKGTNPDGTPYDVPVDYWMPFIDNQVGLHDNPNRTIFGWPWAFRDAGSHGCCNLPYDKAQTLFSLVTVGTPVIVHW